MKHSILLFLFAGILFIPFAFGATHHTVHNESIMIQSTSRIDLYGDFRKGGLRSGTDPIIVELLSETLFISFQNDVGILDVTLIGAAEGVVYNTSVDTTSPSTLTIPLVNFPSGNYTIMFSNQYGTMQGDFTI